METDSASHADLRRLRELQLIPGSKEAIMAGCICLESKYDDKYLINEHCPIHWHVLMVSRTTDMHHYIERRDAELGSLLLALIVAVIVTFCYFLFGVA